MSCCIRICRSDAKMGAQLQSSQLCSHPEEQLFGVSISPSGQHALVTVQGDGVACYDAGSQRLTRTYPLGNPRLTFQTPAVLNSSSGLLHAAVASGTGSTAQHQLVSWPMSGPKSTGSAQTAAQAIRSIADIPQHVPLHGPAHSVHVLRAAGCDAVGVVLKNGGVGCCRHDAVELNLLPASNTTPALRGSCSLDSTLAVLYHAAGAAHAVLKLYTLTLAASSSAPSLSLNAEIQVATPNTGATALSVSLSKSYALVSWSSGHLTVVRGALDRPASVPRPQLSLTPPAALAPAQQAADSSSGASKKRKAAAASAGAASMPLLAAPVDDSQVVVCKVVEAAATATTPAGLALQYALMDCQFGCTLCSGQALLEGASLPSGGPAGGEVQLVAQGGAPGLLVLRVRGAVSVVALRAPKASLLSMLGKLAVVDGASTTAAAERAGAAVAAAGVPVLPVLDRVDAAAVGAALAPVGGDLVLHPLPAPAPAQAGSGGSEVAQVVAALVEGAQQGQAPSLQVLQRATQLVVAGWTAAGPAAAAAGPKGGKKRTAAAASKQQQLEAAAAPAVPAMLAPLTANALAQASQWALLGELLTAAPYRSLAGCASVLPAVARAQQYGLLPLASFKLDDVPPHVVVEAVRALLAPTTPANADARKAHKARLRAAAAAVVGDCEAHMARLGGPQVEADDGAVQARRECLALARCVAAAVDGFSAGEVLLHTPLAMNVDVAGLQAAVKALPNAAVDRLMLYLGKWCSKYTHSLGELAVGGAVNPPLDLQIPRLHQVLEWLRVVLDAHLPRLLMQQGLPQGLADAMGALKAQTSACAGLVGLAGATEHVRNGAPLPAAHIATATAYTVQLVELGGQGGGSAQHHRASR